MLLRPRALDIREPSVAPGPSRILGPTLTFAPMLVRRPGKLSRRFCSTVQKQSTKKTVYLSVCSARTSIVRQRIGLGTTCALLRI